MAICSPRFGVSRISTFPSDTDSFPQSNNHNFNFEFRVSACYKPLTSKNREISHSFRITTTKCSKTIFSVTDSTPEIDNGSGGDNGNGRNPAGGGGGGSGGGGNEEDDNDEKEFGPIIKFEQVIKEAEMRGADLPLDMLEAAKTTGLRRLILTRYLDLQVHKLSNFRVFV